MDAISDEFKTLFVGAFCILVISLVIGALIKHNSEIAEFLRRIEHAYIIGVMLVLAVPTGVILFLKRLVS